MIKQIARENTKMNNKELDEELAKKMVKPYYFTVKSFEKGFKIKLESHNISHANSILSIIPMESDFRRQTTITAKSQKRWLLFTQA